MEPPCVTCDVEDPLGPYVAAFYYHLQGLQTQHERLVQACREGRPLRNGVVTCPSGHIMERIMPESDGFFACDACKRQPTQTFFYYGCRLCNYDICDQCFDKRVTLASRPCPVALDMGVTRPEGVAVEHILSAASSRASSAAPRRSPPRTPSREGSASVPFAPVSSEPHAQVPARVVKIKLQDDDKTIVDVDEGSPLEADDILIEEAMANDVTPGSLPRDSAPCHRFQLGGAWREESQILNIGPMQYSRVSALARALRRQGSVGPELVYSASPLSVLIIHPGSTKRLCWDLLSIIFLAYDSVSIPFMLSFEPNESLFDRVLKWLTICFWTIDIVASFFTGYQTKRKIVLEPMRIARHYLKFHFWWDLTIVSVDWVLVALGDHRSGGSAARIGRTLRILKLLKTLRLIRTVKFKRYIQAVQDEISSEAVSIWFGIFQVVLLLLLVNHWVACLWYTVGKVECDCVRPGWVNADNMEKFSIPYRYATSLHWSLAQFTPAPNEVFPQTVYERIFATVVLLIALVAFSAFVSTVTAGVVQLRNLRNKETRQFWQLRRYLRDWQVRPTFRRRMIHYLEYAFEKQRRRVQERDVELLQLLSEPLREDLRHETLKAHLMVHPLFLKSTHHARVFSSSLGSECFGVSDVVFNCGDDAYRMIFVGAGQLEYILGRLSGQFFEDSQTSEEVFEDDLDYLDVGRWVSEASLWVNEWMHLGDLLAMSECQIVTLDAKKFGELVASNRPFWRGMTCYAKLFVATLNELARPRLSDLMLGDISPTSLIMKVDFGATTLSFEDSGNAETLGRLVCERLCRFIRRRRTSKPHGASVLISRTFNTQLSQAS